MNETDGLQGRFLGPDGKESITEGGGLHGVSNGFEASGTLPVPLSRVVVQENVAVEVAGAGQRIGAS
jgi:hypothetical protein